MAKIATGKQTAKGIRMSRRKAANDEIVRKVRAEHQPGKRGHGYGALARKYNLKESTVRDWVQYWTRAAA